MAVCSPSFRCLALAIMMIAGILTISSNHMHVSAAKTPNCGKGVGDLVSKCSEYVMKSGPKRKPLPACCEVVNSVNVPCVCSLVNKDIEKVIDMEKVVYVAGCCGKKLAPGTKCGSKYLII